MRPLSIHTFPDPVLKQISHPVEHFDENLKNLSDAMLKLMYDSDGLGLAAPQVGILKQIVVIDIENANQESEPDPQIFINPFIVEKSGTISSEEGCLSVLDFRTEIKRAEHIVLRYQNLEGESCTLEAQNLMAICLQHEVDHLQGILFIDYLPPLKQKMLKKRLQKHARRKDS